MECPECGSRMECRKTIPLRLGRWRYREYVCQRSICWNRDTIRTFEYPVRGWSKAGERKALAEARTIRNRSKAGD